MRPCRGPAPSRSMPPLTWTEGLPESINSATDLHAHRASPVLAFEGQCKKALATSSTQGDPESHSRGGESCHLPQAPSPQQTSQPSTLSC